MTYERIRLTSEGGNHKVTPNPILEEVAMRGGYWKPKGRETFRVWIPWKGKKIFINKYLDGTPMYHESQAKRVFEKVNGEIDQGSFDPALWGKVGSLIFQKAWSVYMDQCPCGADRADARERIFKDYLLPYFKNMSLADIEEHHINDWFSTLPKSYAPSYIRVIRATWKAFLNFNRITRVKALEFPKVKVPKKSIEWLTLGDQGKVMEFIPPQHKPIMGFITAYGCRPSEACNLKKTDLDGQKKIVTFRERKNATDNTLKITPEVEELLRPAAKVVNLEYVFCSVTGLKYTRQVVYDIWTAANKKAHKKYGVKIVSLKNGTRHSLASQLLNKGESTAAVARILGNTPSVVERSYGNISVERTEEILNGARMVHEGGNP